MPLSEDHKPNRTDERARIEDAGGVVVWAGTWRVGGVLAVSRAFGDRLLKKCATLSPRTLGCMHMPGLPLLSARHHVHAPQPASGLLKRARRARQSLCSLSKRGCPGRGRYVVATPDLHEEVLGVEDEALVMATDGLWDVISNQEAINFIKDVKVLPGTACAPLALPARVCAAQLAHTLPAHACSRSSCFWACRTQRGRPRC